jgi:hypothetical protein
MYYAQKGTIKKVREYYKDHDICSSPKFHLNNFRSLLGQTFGTSNSTLFLGDITIGDIEEGYSRLPVIIKEITIPCKYTGYKNIQERWARFKRDDTESKYSDNDLQINEIGYTNILSDYLLLKKNRDNTNITSHVPLFYFYANCKNIYPNNENKSLCTGEDIKQINPPHLVDDTRLYKNLYKLYQNASFTEDTNLMIVEKLDGDVSALIENILEEIKQDLEHMTSGLEKLSNILKSIYYQLIYILLVLNTEFKKFCHNDLHLGNILFLKKNPENMVCDIYSDGKYTRKIFNDCGFIIKLWDFGTSYLKIISDIIKKQTKEIDYKDDYPFLRKGYIYTKDNLNPLINHFFSYMDEGQIFNTHENISNDLETVANALEARILEICKEKNIAQIYTLIKKVEGYKLFVNNKNKNLSEICNMLWTEIKEEEKDKYKEDNDNYFKLIISKDT